ncbi:MAG: carboxypeptidase regulatory-like domain-containing protein [Gemmatimonadetes bacterium]|nr:carboxypeptidase regulatory-like domain-containing protein [Gemmatimonadota bacterium]
MVTLDRKAVAAAVLVLAAMGPLTELEAQRRTEAGVITGVVIDQESVEPLADVRLVLVPYGEGREVFGRTAVTNQDGRFLLSEVAGGAYDLRVELLGYGDRSDSLEIDEGTFLDISVSLGIEAIELDEISVTVGSVVLARQGFYDRKRQGFRGTFIERSEIEEEQPASVTELFQNVRGVTVVWGGVYGSQVFMNQRSSLTSGHPGCRPEVWLDGIRSTIESLDIMRVEELEGIEVYRGGAPGKFNDPCGTIAIWTKRVIR